MSRNKRTRGAVIHKIIHTFFPEGQRFALEKRLVFLTIGLLGVYTGTVDNSGGGRSILAHKNTQREWGREGKKKI